MNYDGLPESLRGGMQRYVEQGIKPGDFLCAVLDNDLMEAFSRADAHHQAHMADIVKWVYCRLPGNLFGKQNRIEWQRAKRAAMEAE